MSNQIKKYIDVVWLLPAPGNEKGQLDSIALGQNGILSIERRRGGDIWVERPPIERGRGDSNCVYSHRVWHAYPAHRIAQIKYVEVEGKHNCCGRKG